MLGEKVAQGKGRVTARRVLSSSPTKMEVSFESAGELLGVKVNEIGTYWSELRPDGTMYGEGNGVVMGPSGEVASWKGQGIGVFQDKGGVAYRGALYYQTQSEKWTRLNRVAVAFEFNVDAEGNTTGTLHEWR
jgi:hypothetical protein